MSGISSGIGLISGIDTANLIDQLMAIEARPVRDLQARVQAIDVQRAAFLQLSAQILAIQNSVLQFDDRSFFRRFNSVSSNDKLVTATADESAVPGSYTFRVHSLVTNHAVISRGFADADKTPIGVGTISIEVGNGRVNPGTELDILNGGAGLRRGTITITDGSGASTEIDLTTALTVEDVLDAINRATAIDVRASVTSIAHQGATGDRIVLEDLSGGPDSLVVTDAVDGFTAADLGIAGSGLGRIDGGDLIRLTKRMPLRLLNDGNGVDRFRQGVQTDDLLFEISGPNAHTFGVSLSGILAEDLDTDLRVLNQGNGVRLGTIRITDRNGSKIDVDLTGATSVRDVLDAINTAASNAGMALSITVVNSHFQLSDAPSGADDDQSNLIVEDLSGFAAADLGLAANIDADAVIGPDIYSITTVGDVINAINFASGNNEVQASISADGNSLVLQVPGPADSLTVTAGEGSNAAADLGILDAVVNANEPFQSRRLIAGLNTVLLRTLNGGAGIGVGEISLVDGLGQTATVDVSQAQTLQEVIDLINADTIVSLVASINSAGNGIEIRDDSGGTGDIIIGDVTGTPATDLGIAGTFAKTDTLSVSGGNLQRQYISRQTLLSELNGGQGVVLGSFRIADSTGGTFTVNLASNLVTVGQVIDFINRATPETLEARINDTGDGIKIVDTSGGANTLTIEDVSGSRTAADLRLVGTAEADENFIDGSFEIRIDLGAGDTLNDLVAKLNEAGGAVTASVLNDGSTLNPFSLAVTSTASGRKGELVIDSAGLDLGFNTLTRAQDAIVTLGGSSAASPLLISSSNNTLDDVIEGVSLNLVSPGEEDVTITIAQDVDGIVEAVQSFVDRYNTAQASIDEAISFNVDTLQRGPLLGDRTVNQIRNRLHRIIQRPFEGVDDRVSRLFSIGIRLGGDNLIEFDEDRFREAYDSTPRIIEDLFSTPDTGLGAVLEQTLEELTQDFDGVIPRKDNLLSDQQEIINDRIDQLNVQLDARRARLEAQFIALEISLARLQDQQASLASLTRFISTG